MTAKLSKSDKCRLCLEDQAVETPIHIFSECPAMAGFRMVLSNNDGVVSFQNLVGPLDILGKAQSFNFIISVLNHVLVHRVWRHPFLMVKIQVSYYQCFCSCLH